MVDIKKLVRKNVEGLEPYSCTRDEFEGKKGIFLDANENPYGTLNRYPDPYQKELKEVISGLKGVPVDNIFLGNGSDEVIDLCYRTFCNPGSDKVLLFPPTYGMYEVSASANDVKIIRVPLTDDFQIDIAEVMPYLLDDSVKLIFICSPNNPTGNSMNSNDIEKIISEFDGIVVIDEAYINFSNRPSLLRLRRKYINMILMHTFSKAYGMAAARVGAAFCDPEIIRYFNKLKPPYNISTINQKAVLKKLGKNEDHLSEVDRIVKERERLCALLEKLEVVEKVYPSDANFFLVKVKNPRMVYSTLVEKEIIVRNRDSVIPGCMRITVGKPSENNRLIKELKSFIPHE